MSRNTDALLNALAETHAEGAGDTDGAERPEGGEHKGEIVETAEAPAGWISTEEAAAQFGISKRKLQRAAASGDVRATRMGRTLMFDPADLTSLAPDRPVVEQAVALLAQAHRHQEAIFALVQRPLAQLLELNQQAVTRAYDRIEQLEKERAEWRDKIQEAESTQNVQAIAVLEAETQQQIKADAWQTLKVNAPAILALLGAKKSGTVRDATFAGALRAFLDSLAPEQLQEIAKHLTPAQLAALQSIREAKAAGETQPSAPEPSAQKEKSE